MNNKLYIKTDISLLIDIFLFNHTYVYTYKITLTFVFLFILLFFRVFSNISVNFE